MKFWFDFFRDKRFSWDFKIANLIMRDSLRNYIAVDCLVLDGIVEDMRNNASSQWYAKRLSKVVRDLKILMCCREIKAKED